MKTLLDFIKGQQSLPDTPDYDAMEKINEFKNNINLFFTTRFRMNG